MTNLVEFKVSKAIFDTVKNDPGFRLGFEAEFHVQNASDLIRDQYGEIPRTFQTYSHQLTPAWQDNDLPDYGHYGDSDIQQSLDRYEDWQEQGNQYHEDETLVQLCRLFEQHLGLAPEEMEFGPPHVPSNYRKWKLTTDSSLSSKPNLLRDPDHDIGVELVSPVMTLREGLVWMAKVFQMIATFAQGEIRLYTSNMCSTHVNLSHVLMEYQFDYAKLAIMGGDEHYLDAFKRIGNKYSQPILRAVYDQLVANKEGRANAQNSEAALDLLKLRGWDARRVMYDLSTMIPLDHHMSIDFRRVTSNNPYIEIRVAGNALYEQRYDEIAKMTIRYASLIKIACDPNQYRDEYLKKVYQLVAGVTPTPQQNQQPQQQAQSAMPRIRVFLQPVMSRMTRDALNQIETYHNAGTLTVTTAAVFFLVIMRSALDMRLMQEMRIRQGLNMLLNAISLTPNDLLKSLKQVGALTANGVIRKNEKPTDTLAMLSNAIKSLSMPVTRQALMQSALERVKQQQENMIQEQQRKRRTKRRLLEQEILKRKKEEREKLELALREHRRLQAMDGEDEEEPGP